MYRADHSQTQPPAPLAISAEHMQARMSAGEGAGPGISAAPLVYTQELRPRRNHAGSQPFYLVETHDPKTGEILEFHVPENHQGFVFPAYTQTDHQNARNDRYAMRWALDALLPGSRQTKCHRWRVPKKDAELKLSVEHQKAFFSGLEVCGSVWGCPLCAPKITERRRVEVESAMARAQEMGLQVMLLTLTVPHGMGDDVRVVLDQMKKAWRKGTDSRAGKTMRKMIGLTGTIRVLEVTYGENGFHPHFHVMLFTDSSFSPEIVRRLWYPIWLDGCRKSGLDDPSEAHGVRVDDGTHAANYVTKWGMDSELTKGHLKKGRKSVNPWDLLRVYTFGVDDPRISPELRAVLAGLGIDKKKAAGLWLAFFHAFRGSRQLYWSNGLRALLGLTKEKTDQELAEEQIDPLAALLAVLNARWPDIVTTRSNSRILNQAEDDPSGIPDLLSVIREEAKQKREKRKNDTLKKQKKRIAENEQKFRAAQARERAEGDPGRSEAQAPQALMIAASEKQEDNMLSRNSERVLMQADSFDIWPADFGGGHLVVVFLGGFSSLLYHASDMGGGPMVWPDAQRAVAFVHAHRPLLPRHECDPGPREWS